MIVVGDVRERLADLPERSVQCVVTSPPYWSLRDYGTEGQIWGADGDCDHEWGAGQHTVPSDTCILCGAWRGGLGLEPTVEAYVANMVEVFRAVWRVMRDDGTLWLNLGDSYVSGGSGARDSVRWPKQSRNANGARLTNRTAGRGLKHKDLVGIPWRVAFALQADGWYLRSDIIWHKPNSMPESVTDRPAKSHEYLFLLTKLPRYFYDAEAVKERVGTTTSRSQLFRHGNAYTQNQSFQNDRTVIPLLAKKAGSSLTGRNRRTVWTISTQSFPEGHFATFPEKLVEPCILAGTSERGACADCGAPWVRQIETTHTPGGPHGKIGDLRSAPLDNDRLPKERTTRHDRTTVWKTSCPCHTDAMVPCIVLDPFAGSGTVGVVCAKRDRRFIGIELNPDYASMAERRIAKHILPLFADHS